MEFIATAKIGLESTVAFQLHKLGILDTETLDARVKFRGGYEEMARALLWLRTAERLFLTVDTFRADTFESLFEQTRRIRWEQYLTPRSRIHVNGKSAKSTLFSVSDCQSIVKKAIVESLRSAYRVETIPETEEEVIIEVGILRDEVTISLDCCGAGLSRRGFRTYNVPAPLSETLGAGLILLSRFFPDTPLIDPMCGSGTIPIEAAMIANNIAPSGNRTFAAEQWRFADSSVFRIAREEANDVRRHDKLDILGCDIDGRSIELCKKHAKKAGVMINWVERPVSKLETEWKNGVLICNPPYGERLSDKNEVKKLYREMRTVFDRIPDWQINVITASREFESIYGKTADRRRKLSNGGMPCTLYQYYPQKRNLD